MFQQSCESLENIDRISEVRYRYLVENYLNRDVPAIITDAMSSWAAMNTDFFWFDNITHVRNSFLETFFLPQFNSFFANKLRFLKGLK